MTCKLVVIPSRKHFSIENVEKFMMEKARTEINLDMSTRIKIKNGKILVELR